jgi:putative transposase
MNTVAELYFTDKDLEERWSRVRDDYWQDLTNATVQAVKKLLETSMAIEIQDLVGTRRWEHRQGCRIYRNGSYRRGLLSSLGWIRGLEVPRLRSGDIIFKCLGRYKYRAPDVDKLVLEMFLAGVSTRRVKEVLNPILGQQALSSTTVSRISRVLDKEVERFHRHKISDDYVYLIFDAVYLKIKSPVNAKRRCVLVAYGVKNNGVRELIDFRLARTGESQTAWECFLTSLFNRGLKGENLLLTAMDGNKGLYNALDLIWPDVPRQRCWAHKLRNVVKHLPRRLQKSCSNQARDIYDAKDEGEAIKAYKKWARFWRPISVKAVDCLEQDLEDLLNFYKCPKPMWIKIRTTNAIERVFREVRRRTRPMSCFTNSKSVDRIIYAIFFRQNNLWREKPLKEITQYS